MPAPSILILATAYIMGTALVLLACLVMSPFLRTRPAAKRLAAGAVLSFPSLLAHQVAAAPAALLILAAVGPTLPSHPSPLTAIELFYIVSVLLPSLIVFLGASLYGILFGYRFAALLLAGSGAKEALLMHPAARLLRPTCGKRALRLAGGLYAVACGGALYWWFQPAPPSGYYSGADLGCMCGPGYWQFLDGKIHAYSPAHESRSIVADYRAAGNRTWVSTPHGWRPLLSRGGTISCELSSGVVLRGYKVFLSWVEARRLLGFTQDGVERWDWHKVVVRTKDGRVIGGHVPWSDHGVPFTVWARALGDKTGSKPVPVYKEIVRLRFPREGPVIVGGRKEEVPLALISSIEALAPPADPSMGGIAEATDAEMALLLSGAPRYKFETAVTGRRATALFAAYGKALAPKRLIWHAAAALADQRFATLSVNGVRLEHGASDSPTKLHEALAETLPPEVIPDFLSFAREHQAYKASLAAMAKLREDYAKLNRRLRASKKPGVEEMQKKLAKAMAELEREQNAARRRLFRPLGTRAELAKQGVVGFEFPRLAPSESLSQRR